VSLSVVDVLRTKNFTWTEFSFQLYLQLIISSLAVVKVAWVSKHKSYIYILIAENYATYSELRKRCILIYSIYVFSNPRFVHRDPDRKALVFRIVRAVIYLSTQKTRNCRTRPVAKNFEMCHITQKLYVTVVGYHQPQSYGSALLIIQNSLESSTRTTSPKTRPHYRTEMCV
jgi:hypothetical protein